MGNRLTRRLASLGTTTTDTYSYPSTSNRLQSVAGGQARTFTYDAAGNITYDNRSGTGFGYGYNAKNRMESVSINGVVQSEFDYNALGQQVIRRLTVGGQTIHSVHDADGVRVAEYDYDSGTQISTLLREYVWMNGQIIAVIEGGVVYYVRTDHIGRPVFATDDSGTKVWEASYLPFGGAHTSTGANSDLRFPGQWFQSEAGLHQNWMRDYDPTTGRYVQADPLGLVDGPSIYGYALQNPGFYVDPTGERVQFSVFGGRACNNSSKCIAIWTDKKVDDPDGIIILKPGQCTPYFGDFADFLRKDKEWYKCRALGTCYAYDDKVTQFGPVRPSFNKQPRRIEEPGKWIPGQKKTEKAEKLLREECGHCGENE